MVRITEVISALDSVLIFKQADIGVSERVAVRDFLVLATMPGPRSIYVTIEVMHFHDMPVRYASDAELSEFRARLNDLACEKGWVYNGHIPLEQVQSKSTCESSVLAAVEIGDELILEFEHPELARKLTVAFVSTRTMAGIVSEVSRYLL